MSNIKLILGHAYKISGSNYAYYGIFTGEDDREGSIFEITLYLACPKYRNIFETTDKRTSTFFLEKGHQKIRPLKDGNEEDRFIELYLQLYAEYKGDKSRIKDEILKKLKDNNLENIYNTFFHEYFPKNM